VAYQDHSVSTDCLKAKLFKERIENKCLLLGEKNVKELDHLRSVCPSMEK
jgi:hypothetical protein